MGIKPRGLHKLSQATIAVRAQEAYNLCQWGRI